MGKEVAGKVKLQAIFGEEGGGELTPTLDILEGCASDICKWEALTDHWKTHK